MTWPILVFVLAALSAMLLLWDFLARFEADESAIELMSRHDLYALPVLRILESPDYRFHSQRSKDYRQFLFSSFASKLRQDVEDLGELPFGSGARFCRWLFHLGFWALSLKARIWTGGRDLRVLLGIELLMIRALTTPPAAAPPKA